MKSLLILTSCHYTYLSVLCWEWIKKLICYTLPHQCKCFVNMCEILTAETCGKLSGCIIIVFIVVTTHPYHRHRSQARTPVRGRDNHSSDGGISFSVVAILLVPCSLLVHMFYLAYMFLINDISCFMEIYALSYFNCFLKYFLVFFGYIYSPTCQTVVFDPFFWYSSPDPVIIEVEPEGAASEPQRLVEWQADNVM